MVQSKHSCCVGFPACAYSDSESQTRQPVVVFGRRDQLVLRLGDPADPFRDRLAGAVLEVLGHNELGVVTANMLQSAKFRPASNSPYITRIKVVQG